MRKDRSADRIYYLDNLRMMGMVTIFGFHSAMFFVSWRWHIDNAESSFVMDSFVRFIHLWIMPLFFVLSGAATRCSLRIRSCAQYLTERFRRLIIPLITGIAVIVPLQVYLERLSRSEFNGSYFHFYGTFFGGLYPQGNFTLNHLWFLPCLFVFSLLAAVFERLYQAGRLRPVHLQLIRSKSPWIICIPLLILGLIEGALRYAWPLYLYPADMLIFFSYFLYGYLIVSEPLIGYALQRYSRTALITGISAFSVITALYYLNRVPAPGSTWSYVLFHLCWSMTGWLWIVAILGLGMRYLDVQHSVLNAASEAVLPVYMLHQTVILFAGYYVVQWDMGVLSKYVTIAATASMITGILYAVIWQSDTARLLFGMRLKTEKRRLQPCGLQHLGAPYSRKE